VGFLIRQINGTRKSRAKDQEKAYQADAPPEGSFFSENADQGWSRAGACQEGKGYGKRNDEIR
jgi:hypothetical protein